MYYTRPMGWIGPSGTYSPHHPPKPHLTTPSRHFPWRRLLIVAVGAGLIGLGGTAGLQLRAAQLVKFQPSASVDPSAPSTTTGREPALPPQIEQSATTAALDPVADQKLQSTLENWAASHPTHKWSVVVKGLGADTRFANLNAQEDYRSASIYKLFLTYPLFQLHSLDSLENFTVYPEGRSPASLKSCVDAMLRRSDNPCAAAVGDYIGWSRADKLLARAGFVHTQLNNAAGPQTTAADTADFLRNLDSGGLFSDDQRQFVLDILKNQNLRSGIPAGCAGCVVADKTGDLGFVRHDAGIVYFSANKYILVIFTNGASYSEIAGLTSQIQARMSQP